MFKDAFLDWFVFLSVIGCRIVVSGNLVDNVGGVEEEWYWSSSVLGLGAWFRLSQSLLCRGKLGSS